MAGSSSIFARIPLAQLEVSENNVRQKEAEVDLDELMSSLSQYGLQQPIVVQAKGEQYEILIGQRRFLAASKLGWEEIDAKRLPVRLDKLDATILSFSENAQRRDITAGDKIAACKYLHDELGSISAVSQRLGLSPKTVRKWLGVSALPDPIQTLVKDNRITPAAAKSIAAVYGDDEEKAVKMAERVAKERPTADERTRIIDTLEADPRQTPDEVVKNARENRVRQEITFVLPPQWHARLEQVAGELETDVHGVAKSATIEWLEGRYSGTTSE